MDNNSQQLQQQQQKHLKQSVFRNVGLEDLRGQMEAFAAERHWEQYHTPRNLLLALVGEVGELSEIFQWRGEVKTGLPDFTAAERTHVGQELSDVLLYLIRLADACGIDLGQAVCDKMEHNAKKYPVEKCRGSSAKYTAYTSNQQQQEQQEEQPQDQQQQPDQETQGISQAAAPSDVKTEEGTGQLSGQELSNHQEGQQQQEHKLQQQEEEQQSQMLS